MDPIEPGTFFVRGLAAAEPVSSKCLTPQRVKPEAAEEMRDHERLLVAYFDETFVVMVGVALADGDVREVVAFHKERGALATLALTPVSDTSQYGVEALNFDANYLRTTAWFGLPEVDCLAYLPYDPLHRFLGSREELCLRRNRGGENLPEKFEKCATWLMRKPLSSSNLYFQK